MRGIMVILAKRLATGRRGLGPTVRTATVFLRLWLRNVFSRTPVVGTSDVDVSMTTYGSRTRNVYLTLESVGRGRARPRRLILWIDDPDVVAHPSPALRRLCRRGLEILACEDLGPHKKQYPYVTAEASAGRPFVTADDDVVYPPDWLAELLGAHHEHPDAIVAHRAHRVARTGDRIAPYSTWVAETGNEPSFATLPTGTSGVLYPPGMVDALRRAGRRFEDVAPRADDIWVHAVAVEAGIRTLQVGPEPAHYMPVPGSQSSSLFSENGHGHGNDRQVASTYPPEAVARIVSEAVHAQLVGDGA